MNVLLVTDAYPPEIRSSSILMRELAVGLADRGHRITVLTTFPVYNLADSDRTRFSRLRGNLLSMEDGLRIIRIPTPPLHNVGPMAMGLGQLSLPFLLSLTGSLLSGIDAIIAYSPPLPLALAAIVLKSRFDARLVLNVQDMFPQNAIDLGILRHPLLIRAFEEMETIAYRNADILTCHSQGNQVWLRRHHELRKRSGDVRLIHNWVETERPAPVERVPSMRTLLDLDGRFVFIHGGVMGFAQDLSTVVEAARCLRERRDLVFVLVGDGVERDGLRQLSNGLDNVVFHPFVPPDEYDGWLRSADAGIVTLKSDMKTPVVPSKMLAYMAAGIPYLAVLNPESDGREITLRSGGGILVDPGDSAGLAGACVKLADDRSRSRSIGALGRQYCLKYFAPSVCIDKYHHILQSLSRE